MKIDNTTLFSLIISSLFLIPNSISSAAYKSILNRYAFSDDYIDAVDSLFRMKAPHFYSLPCNIPLDNNPFVSFSHDNHTISAELYSIFSYEYEKRRHLPNGFLGACLSYDAPHIRGEFRFDAHTTKRLKPSGFADSLKNVGFEQLKTNYDHIAGTGVNKDFNFQTGYIELSFANLSLLSGKYPLRWGPGYKGTLGLSGTTFSPYYYYILRLDMASRIHAGAFLCGLDDSYLFVKDSASNADRFGAGQRLDVRIGDNIQIGFYEFVNFNGTALLARYANPVQLYYISTHLGGGVNERRNNIMGGMDCNFIYGPLRIYADFLNDDLTPFDDNGSPNKFGFQAGGVYYGGKVLREIGFEYTHVSRWTYGHWTPGLNSHVYFGESRGWPWGNDQDLWHLRALFILPFNLRLDSEVNWRVKGEGTLKEYHWDIPDSIRSDLDNKGGMCDYKKDKHLFTFQIRALWKPWRWMSAEVMWLPYVAEKTIENNFRFCVVLSVPSGYKVIF